MSYPKGDYWDSKPDSWKVEYLSLLLESERKTVERITGYWLNAARRIRELEG